MLGHFNSHLCCLPKPLVTEFKIRIDSFDFVQWVHKPAHGHTLNLILSHGLQISDIAISETCFSDNRLVLFSSHLPNPVVATPSVARLNHYLSTQSCKRFAASYAIADPPVPELSSPVHNVNRLFNLSNQKCLSTLNLIAPLKPKCIVTKLQPWFNDSTCFLRKACRRAEQKWGKDKLQVSYEMWRDSLCVYQRAVKVAKSKYIYRYRSLLVTIYTHLRSSSLLLILCSVPLSTFS